MCFSSCLCRNTPGRTLFIFDVRWQHRTMLSFKKTAIHVNKCLTTTTEVAEIINLACRRKLCFFFFLFCLQKIFNHFLRKRSGINFDQCDCSNPLISLALFSLDTLQQATFLNIIEGFLRCFCLINSTPLQMPLMITNIPCMSNALTEHQADFYGK